MLAHCQGAIRHNWYLLRSSILCAFVGAVAVAVAGWQTSSSSSLSFSSSSSSFSSSYLWFEIAVASLVHLLYQVHSHLQGDWKNGSLRSSYAMTVTIYIEVFLLALLVVPLMATQSKSTIGCEFYLQIIFSASSCTFNQLSLPFLFAAKRAE